MKTLFSFLAFHLFSVCLWSQTLNVTVANVGNVVKAAAGGVTYLLSENFEGTGYQNCCWAEDSNPNEDYTATALEGSQSFNSAADGSRAYTNITSSTELWIYALVRFNSINDGEGWTGFTDPTGKCYWDFYGSSQKVRLHQGTNTIATSAPIATALAINTTYHVWMHWKNDGTASLEINEGGTKSGDGDDYTSCSGGDGNYPTTTIMIGMGRAHNIIIDKLRVSNTDPGNNPS